MALLDDIFVEYANLLNQGYAPSRLPFPRPLPRCPQCSYQEVYPRRDWLTEGCRACGLGFMWCVGLEDEVVRLAWAWAPVCLALTPWDKLLLAELVED